MRLKGEFTVEATFIFSFFLIMIVAFINLDLTLHDAVVSDAAKVNGGIEYRESMFFCRNADNGIIDKSAVIGKPLIGKKDYYSGQQKLKICQNVSGYYDTHRFSAISQISETDIEDVMTAGDNAQIVRAGGKAVQIIGGDR